MATGAQWFSMAMRTVREGLSARAGLIALRAGGGRTGDSMWFRMVAEARRTLADRADETGRPLNRRPLGDEITRMTTRARAGYWQQVEVFARSRATGEVYSSPFVLRGEGLVTRAAAISFALGEWEAGSSGTPNPDDDEVLGAAYVSTLELFPADSTAAADIGGLVDTRSRVTPGASGSTPVMRMGLSAVEAGHNRAVRDAVRALQGRTDLPTYGIMAAGAQGPVDVHQALRAERWVSLVDLRRELPGIPRRDLDALLVRLAAGDGDPDVTLSGQHYGWAITDEQRADSITMGDAGHYWIRIAPGGLT